MNPNDQVWRCQYGHEYRGAPWELVVRIGQEPYTSGPLCPVCYVNGIGMAFRAQAVTTAVGPQVIFQVSADDKKSS